MKITQLEKFVINHTTKLLEQGTKIEDIQTNLRTYFNINIDTIDNFFKNYCLDIMKFYDLYIPDEINYKNIEDITLIVISHIIEVEFLSDIFTI